MKNELETLYKKTLDSIRKKEKELENEKQLLKSLEDNLKDYLGEHKGKLFKLVEKPVAFDTAAYWKTNFPSIHEKCSVTIKTKRFDIELVKENYPNKYKKASKQTEQVIVLKK